MELDCWFRDRGGRISEVLHSACNDGMTPSEVLAVARNLLAEHRISQTRYEEFARLAAECETIEALREAVNSYQYSQVRPDKSSGIQPAYVRPENQNNEIRSARDIATVLDLTRLGRIYAEARARFRMPEFRGYAVTNPRDSAHVNEFLADRLNKEKEQEPFLRALFKAMSRYRQRIESRILPCWAAEWNSLAPYLDPSRPDRWIEAVGVPREDRTWLMVVRYPAPWPLFRPTQIDAGWYAQHFPSPPQVGLESGGYTMDLAQHSSGDEKLVSEYIHAQVDFNITHWIAAGRLVQQTRHAVNSDLRSQRKRHWQRLQEDHGPEVATWMPKFL